MNSGKNIKLQSAPRKYTLGEIKNRASKEVSPAIECQETISIPNSLVLSKITIPNPIYTLDRPPDRRVFVDNLNIMIMSESEFIGVKRYKIRYLFQIVILLHILTEYEKVELLISDARNDEHKQRVSILTSLVRKLEETEPHLDYFSDDKQQQIAIIHVLIKPGISASTTKFPTYKLAKTLDFNTGNEILDTLVSHTKRNYEILIAVLYYPKVNETIDYMIHVCYGQIESPR